MENQNSILGDSALGSKYFDPAYLVNKVLIFFQNLYDFFIQTSSQIISIFNVTLFFFSLFFVFVIAYTTVRMFEIRKKEKKHLEDELAEFQHHQAEKEKKAQQGDAVSKNPRWLKTLAYLFSQHASDWKLAIIEADSMLEELLDQLGFKGENLGEKLKGATQDKFRGLTSAWEVHTIRNKIAHEGAAYEISQHEARRVIATYESIFREFGFI